jgi:hypothetical protein
VNGFNVIDQETSLLQMIKDYKGTDGMKVDFFYSDVALKSLTILFPIKLVSIVSVFILMFDLLMHIRSIL